MLVSLRAPWYAILIYCHHIQMTWNRMLFLSFSVMLADFWYTSVAIMIVDFEETAQIQQCSDHNRQGSFVYVKKKFTVAVQIMYKLIAAL